MNSTQETAGPSSWAVLLDHGKKSRFLQWALLALALAPALTLVFKPEAVFGLSRSLALALVLVAMVPAPRFERPAEHLFWQDLALALGLWLLSRTLMSIAPSPAPLLWDLLIETVNGAHYIILVLALERRPHLAERRRAHLEGTLIRPTVATLVAGVLAYFVLVPLATASRFAVESAYYSYCTLDTYLVLRLLHLRFQARKTLRWRLFYSLLAAALALLLLGDLESLLLNLQGGASPLPHPLPLILWLLPFVPLLFLARLRHSPQLPHTRPVEARSAEGIHSTTSLETLLVALAFPLIHLLGTLSGLFDPAHSPLREVVVLIWLLLLGALAFGQHRLANRQARVLAERKAHTAAALAKNQAGLRLIKERQQAQRQLHDVESRSAAIFRASPSGLLICDLEGCIREVNQNFEKISGRPREVLLAQSIPDLGLWADPELHGRMVQRLQGGDTIHNEMVELNVGPKARRAVRLSAELLDADGPPALLAVVRPMQPQPSLPSRHLETVELSLVGVDPKGRLCCLSRGAERLYELNMVDVLGQPAEDVVESLAEPGHDPNEVSLPFTGKGRPLAVRQRVATVRDGQGERLVLALPEPQESPHP